MTPLLKNPGSPPVELSLSPPIRRTEEIEIQLFAKVDKRQERKMRSCFKDAKDEIPCFMFVFSLQQTMSTYQVRKRYKISNKHQ